MRITERQQELEGAPPKHFFTHSTNDTTFNYLGHGSIHTTTVYFLHPPPLPPSPYPTTSNYPHNNYHHHHHDEDRRPWIVAAIEDTLKLRLRHPLTLNPHPSTLPKTNFSYSTLAVSYHASYFFDKLVITEDRALFALYNGGVLRARSGNSSDWIALDDGDSEDKFDDIVVYKGKVYVLDRDGRVFLINNSVKLGKIRFGKTVIKCAVGSEFKWRKRVVIDGVKRMYLVVRTGEKGLEVYKKITRGKADYWEKVKSFDGNKVLFMSKDYCFFVRASVIGVKRYKNCIVFSQWAFPSYGDKYWEYSSFNLSCVDAVFRLKDHSFSAESEINWSAPYWTKQQSSGLNVASFRAYAARCRISGVQVEQLSQVDQYQSSSDSDIESERDPDEDEGLDSEGEDEEGEVQSDSKDSDSQDEEGEVQSDSKDSDSKDDEQEEMESDSDSQNKDQEGVESDSGSQDQDKEGVESDSSSQDQEEEKMQCDSDSQEKEDEQTHLNGNTDGGSSLLEGTKVSGGKQSQTHPSKTFTLKTDESAFTRRRMYVYPTIVNLLRPPRSFSSDCPCIIASDTIVSSPPSLQTVSNFRHPLISKPPFWNLPGIFDISELHPSTLAVSYHFHLSYPVDKLLVIPTPPSSYLGGSIDVRNYTLLALYGGGELQGCPCDSKESWRSYKSAATSTWVKLSSGEKFDDIIIFQDKIYAVDRQGFTKLINNYKNTRKISIGKYLTSVPITSGSGRFGWRKRLVVDGAALYVVVRTSEKSFQVFMLEWGQSRPAKVVYWKKVTGFDGNKVLFMARDYYFFRQASKKFPGRKYKNCIVFSEAAFPQYGKDCWEFTQSARQLGEDNIAVFRLDDKTFAREGKNPRFPEIDWTPPPWVFLAAKSQSNSSSQSEREPDEDEGLDSGEKNDGEEQSDSKDSDSKDDDDDDGEEEEEEEEVESDSGSQDQDQEGAESDSGSQDQEEKKMKIDGRRLETKLSKQFTRQTQKSVFETQGQCKLRTTTIYLLRPPLPLSLGRLWILSSENTADGAAAVLRHPLTSKPHCNLPRNFDIFKLHPTTITVSHHYATTALTFDKLLVIPTPSSSHNENTLLGLYDGGHLRGCFPFSSEWVKPSHDCNNRFDDLTIYKDKVYALNRQGKVYVLNLCVKSWKITIGETLTTRLVTPALSGWRKRVVVDGQQNMYLVVRTEETWFQVYKLITQGNSLDWARVKGFDGNRVLFITRDSYFFRTASSKFPGREYKNCIVFTEGAFPRRRVKCWEFTPFSKELGFECSRGENVAVFRLDDQSFGKEGDNGFPKIDWSPPSWIYDALSKSAAEFQSHTSSSSLGQSGRELDKDNGLDSASKDGKVQEAVESDSGSQDQDQKGVEENMECDTNNQEKEDEEMLDANTDGGASLQEDVSPSLLGPKSGTTDTQTPLSAVDNEITRTLSLNGASAAIEEETLRKNISTESALKACTSSTTKSQTSECATTKFEGFDIRSDLVSTLQKIWRKHGNIVEKSIIRNSDIIARALESLATMVRLMEDNTVQSWSDSQADYLASTLSDLRCMCFKVYWLVPYVQKAIKLHKSKSSVESLNNLSQLSSQVKERKAILLDELTKLGAEENKLKEEMEKVSQLIPFCGQVKLGKPLGAGLT